MGTLYAVGRSKQTFSVQRMKVLTDLDTSSCAFLQSSLLGSFLALFWKKLKHILKHIKGLFLA
jgi:hypothetical protein